MMKKLVIIALAVTALFLTPYASSFPDVLAAGNGAAVQQGAKRQGPPRRRELTLEQMQTVMSEKYFLTPVETKKFLDSGVNFRDLDRAALYSFISGTSIEDILALKKHEPWQRVAYLVGAVGQKAYDRGLELKAINLERWWGIPKDVGLHYMRLGYPMHYVKVAYVLSKHSAWTMDTILQDKKYGENWKAWCARNLKISAATYDKWIGEYPNPTYFPGSYF